MDDPHPLILLLYHPSEGTHPAGSAPNAFFLVRRTLALPGPRLSVLESLKLQPVQMASCLLTLVYWSSLFHGSKSPVV